MSEININLETDKAFYAYQAFKNALICQFELEDPAVPFLRMVQTNKNDIFSLWEIKKQNQEKDFVNVGIGLNYNLELVIFKEDKCVFDYDEVLFYYADTFNTVESIKDCKDPFNHVKNMVLEVLSINV